MNLGLVRRYNERLPVEDCSTQSSGRALTRADSLVRGRMEQLKSVEVQVHKIRSDVRVENACGFTCVFLA